MRCLPPLTILGGLAMLSIAGFSADGTPAALFSDWSLALESGEPAWMSVAREDGRTQVHMRVYIGPDGPYAATETSNGRLTFPLRRRRIARQSNVFVESAVDIGIRRGKLDGVIVRTSTDGTVNERIGFSGKRIPPMPDVAPDLSKVHFGMPFPLFNGKDLQGWRPHESDKINGWSAQGGVLVNTTTKTDFSPTGDYANLRTEAEFEDFLAPH